MSQEYYMRVPTMLGLHGTIETQAQPLAATETTDKRLSFVTKYYDTADRVGKLFNLNPVIILAQASLESGWGTSKLARENNNFFGVTAYGKQNQYWTGEKRVSTSSGLPFRSYKTVEAGFSDFARLITSYYKTAAAQNNNVPGYAKAIAYSPYINEKNGDNRERYRTMIIQSADIISQLSKKKSQQQN